MRSLLAASLLLLVPSCIIEEDGDPPDQSAVLLTTSCPGSDGIQVMSYTSDGVYLDVTVGYGGGCADHDVWACWGGEILESEPPQIPIALGHDAHGDSCDAYITETRRFSLDEVTSSVGRTDYIVTMDVVDF